VDAASRAWASWSQRPRSRSVASRTACASCRASEQGWQFVGELVRTVPFLEPFAAFPLNVGPEL
jgi:hypothetical protein